MYLNDTVKAEELEGAHELTKEVGIVCPFCKEALLLKAGEKKVHHFAHYEKEQGVECEARALRQEGKEYIRGLQVEQKGQLLKLFNLYLWDILTLEGGLKEVRLKSKDRGSEFYQRLRGYIETALTKREGIDWLKGLCLKFLNGEVTELLQDPPDLEASGAPSFQEYKDWYEGYLKGIRSVKRVQTEIVMEAVEYLGTPSAKLVRGKVTDCLYDLMLNLLKKSPKIQESQFAAFPVVRVGETICRVPWALIQNRAEEYIKVRKAHTNSRAKGFG